MGFDLSGTRPIINKQLDDTTVYGMIESIVDCKERWVLQDALNKKEKKQYWKQYEQYHKDNPGLYFRNNVWWWRPLWEFVCSTCEDILSNKDVTAGSYNDGRKIGKIKANKIADRLYELLDTGIVDTYEKSHEIQRKKMEEDEDKDIKFFGNYPFDKKNVERFALFCKESGGFQIC